MSLPEEDAQKLHTAIHGRAASVKLSTGESAKVESDGTCRFVTTAGGIKAMEQDKAAKTAHGTKAKNGTKITWFTKARLAKGCIVDGVVEQHGKVISEGPAATAKAKAKAGAKAEAKGKAKARAKPEPSTEDAVPVDEEPPSKQAKTSSGSAAASASSADDPLGLAQLFTGSGHGATWEPILRPAIERLQNAAEFIGPTRNKGIVPVRELTFQALKPNPPGGWNIVSFGQSPFPRIESATGIAHFDSQIKSWEDNKFGAVPTIRCIIKTAVIHKYGLGVDLKIPALRQVLREKNIVGPAEWFQALLSQGVLFMNAACTLLPPGSGKTAGEAVGPHLNFWEPVIAALVEAILKARKEEGKGVVFAWWGNESLKVKKSLEKRGIFKGVPGVVVKHVEHKNPAAQGELFCHEPNIYGRMNAALGELGLPEVDWLPTKDWKEKLKLSAGGEDAESLAGKMGEFIAETQDLHKMYLDRLRDGLELKGPDLADITGICDAAPPDFVTSCSGLGLTKQAEDSKKKAEAMKRGSLTVEEAAAVHLYTTNHLYKKLNEALRSADRSKVLPYFDYLRWLLKAMSKSESSSKPLYRGVALDLSSQYQTGQDVTWWAVSSCTPSLEVASSFAGAAKRTLFEIKPMRSVGIRQLSEYKNEEEFLLLPGTVLKVKSVENKEKLIKIVLEELDRPCRVR